MKELSVSELELVSGAFGPAGAVGGGIIAGAGYLGGAAATGEGDATGFATAVGAGAIGGFVAGPAGAGVAYGAEVIAFSQISFYSGLAAGYISNAFDFSGGDYAGQNYQK